MFIESTILVSLISLFLRRIRQQPEMVTFDAGLDTPKENSGIQEPNDNQTAEHHQNQSRSASWEKQELMQGDIMTDNKIPKLRKSRAEATEKIRSRIDKGKELLETQITTEQEFEKLERETQKWIDRNKTVFGTLFDNFPLPWHHGTANTYTYERYLHQEIADYRKNMADWINDLESVYEQMEEYEELPNNTQQIVNNDAVSNENKKIFIGHGGSNIWLRLKDFIVNRLGLEYEEFNRISPAGKATSDRLEEMLEESCMAFLIMTGEDEQADGSLHARENVIHEAGLFQGKLGFKRAIILIEEGCQEFSNIHGLGQIRFPQGNIRAVFEDIREVLERESIK